MKLNCIIIDDEDPARDIVETYIKDIDFLNIVASCDNALSAIPILNSNKIDLLFLDINMPKLDGLNFLKTLKNPPKVIFTTAYREYAIEGFELDAVDYLCKPFSFNRFLTAVNKAVNRLSENTITSKQPTRENSQADYIFIKSDKKTFRVDLDLILYIEAVGDYIKIITSKGSHITYMYLKDIEQELPSNKFPRVHRSFIVSVSKIDSIDGNRIFMGEIQIPIGKNYRDNLFNLIRK